MGRGSWSLTSRPVRLAEPDAQNLFKLIESLKAGGMTMIYVSHRMPELFRLCDKISVLRDGQYVGTLPRAEATQDAVVKMMIGRSVADYFPQHVSGRRAKWSSCGSTIFPPPGSFAM